MFDEETVVETQAAGRNRTAANCVKERKHSFL